MVPSAFPLVLLCQCVLVFHFVFAQTENFEYLQPEYNPYFFNELFRRSYRRDSPMEMSNPVTKRNIRHVYNNPCEVEYKLVHLSDGVHAFWPSSYYEVHCKNGLSPVRGQSILDLARPPQTCGVEHLVCVQRYDEIIILKTIPRKGESACFEVAKMKKEMMVPSGCDCLEPKDAFDYVQ